MRSSYQSEDVEILLKDITGQVKPQSTEERERLIQSGRHYCEMLPIEYSPTEQYMKIYEQALEDYSLDNARAVADLSEKIRELGKKNIVLVSLARAGIPIGILVKRFLKQRYGIEAKHYSISIIRGRGIDHNAMKYILERHSAGDLVMLDGWIGKGAILKELRKELEQYPGVSSQLAVLADPAYLTDLCGTHEDILIPSSCLNCTVSGLISRTFLREDIIGPQDFHGAVYYGELADRDLSRSFLTTVERQFSQIERGKEKQESRKIHENLRKGLDEVKELCQHFQVEDINLVKPGIGETTRVLLRRVPWKILISNSCKEDNTLNPILKLAGEKGVPVEYYPLKNYKVCGIIKKMSDI